MQSKKSSSAEFRFYEELNDFLPLEYRKKSFLHHFSHNPSIKDVIESIGVPHTEIDLILINNKSVDFFYPLKHGDRVAVYPKFESFDITPLIHLRPHPLRESKFILDVHLGKLARYLRLLGLDIIYQNNFVDSSIAAISLQENRIILTRDIELLKNKRITHGYWLRNTIPHIQVAEVLNRFDLYGQLKPFSRCLLCNNELIPIAKEKIIDRLPAKTRKYFHEFYYCDLCDKVYWKGSHYAKMERWLKEWVKN